MFRYEEPNDYTSYVYGTDTYVHPCEYVAEVNPSELYIYIVIS